MAALNTDGPQVVGTLGLLSTAATNRQAFVPVKANGQANMDEAVQGEDAAKAKDSAKDSGATGVYAAAGNIIASGTRTVLIATSIKHEVWY